MSQAYTIPQKLLQLPGKLFRRLRQHGPLNLVQWYFYQFSWRFRERRLGIDTGEFSHGFQLGDEGQCRGYEPIDHKCFDIIMDHLAIRAGVDGFIDYGCGKGRAVVLAATHPFVQAIGVERSSRLAEIARDNVASAQRHLACADVRIVESDARTWPVPRDITIAFLFNSFGGEILDDVMERIHESLVEHPRRFRLVYAIPKGQHDPIADVTWLRKECDLPTGFWDHITCTVYEYLPG